MDLSKLPKLSQSPAPPPPAQPDAAPSSSSPSPPPPFASRVTEPPRHRGNVGAEAWIRIAIGLIMLLLFPRLVQYIVSPGTFTWTFTDPAGAPMKYTQTAFFWQDLGVTAFSLMLIVDGLTLALARRKAVMVGVLALTLVAILLNLWAIIATTGAVGLPLYCVLAVAFGVYIAIYQWQLISSSN